MPKNIFEKNGLRWVNINQPTEEDIEYIKSVFRFHQLVIKSITSPTLHPTIESYHNHLFLILHFPIIYRNESRNIAAEVDFLITKKNLITITYQPHPKLDELFQKIQKEKKIQNQMLNSSTGKLVHGIIEWLMGSLIHDLDYLEEAVTHIEDEIFEGKHDHIVGEISHIRRDILDFRRITSPMQTVLKELPQIAAKFYGEEMRPYFIDVLTAESKIRHLIENHKETIESLHETNDSLLSNKVSKIITMLTIFSAIILPLNFVASIWGMNQKHIPLRDGPYDFWILMVVMGLITAALVIFFRRKKWL